MMRTMDTSWWRNNEAMLRTLYVLFMGQVVSFSLASMSFSASLVASLGVDAPLTLAFLAYLTLVLVYGGILLYRRRKLLVPLYWYVLLGFVDVQGNYLANKAYQYTSITSVTILDCGTIAWALLFTWLFLGTRYSVWQFFGAAVCVLGLGLVILSDSGVGGGGASNPLLGDTLIIVATVFFAVSNVVEEFCVKKTDRVEVVSMLGLFGMLVCACEIAIVERQSLETIKWSTEIVITFAGFALAGFMFCTFTPFVLKMSGATMLNLSILTSDLWAVLIRIFFYHQQVDWLYYLSFTIVVCGIIIYSKTYALLSARIFISFLIVPIFSCENDHVPVPTLEDGNLNPQYQMLSEESAASKNETMAS